MRWAPPPDQRNPAVLVGEDFLFPVGPHFGEQKIRDAVGLSVLHDFSFMDRGGTGVTSAAVFVGSATDKGVVTKPLALYLQT